MSILIPFTLHIFFVLVGWKLKDWKQFLLIAILWAFIGQPLYFALLQIQHYHCIKTLLKSQIPLEQQTIITSHPHTHLQWTKPEKEFISNGIFYDVIRQEISSDGTKKYYCITDTQEQQLKQQLQNYLQGETSPLNNLFQWLKKIISLDEVTPLSFLKPICITEIPFVYLDIYLTPSYDVADKPPQNI